MKGKEFLILLLVLPLSALRCDGPGAGQAGKWDEAAIARGRQLFDENCAICHGSRGDGQGTRSEGLSPRPPDFTNSQWQVAHPAERVTSSIRNGRRGTAMPSWRSLSEQQVHDLTAFVKSRS
jgi:high-affinity iron transporter